jgi:class 3 adenylate cyclase
MSDMATDPEPPSTTTTADPAAQIEAVRDVLRVISRSPFDVDAVLGIVVERAVKLCHADYGYVFLPGDGVYHLAAWYGGAPEQAEYERQNPTPITRGTLVGRVVLSGEATHIEDALADAEYTFREAQRIGGYRTILGVPIDKEERIIGVFGLARVAVRRFTPEEIELVGTFADQAGVVLDNVRLLRTIERQREELARYLPSTVAELISSPEGQQLLAGHRREISAVACDLRGFTAFAETAEPEEVVDALSEYHREMGRIVLAHGGTVEHYAGDGMMVFLNDPQPVPDHAAEAVRMALEMRDRFAELATRWARSGFELGLGIGVSVGYATLGRIGFEGHYGYAAVGSVANLASRLCALADAGQIMLSRRAYTHVEPMVTAEPLGSFELKGFSRPVEAFGVAGLKGGAAS